MAGFPLVRRFLIGIAFICLCIGSSLFCEEPGRVSVGSLQKGRLRVSVGSYWSDYSTSYRLSGSLLRVCWPAWLSHFLSFPFSSPLSLRGRGATDNARTTLISHSTVCQSTLTDARARTCQETEKRRQFWASSVTRLEVCTLKLVR